MAPFFIAEYAIKFQTVSQSVSEWLGLSRRWPLVISSLIRFLPPVPSKVAETQALLVSPSPIGEKTSVALPRLLPRPSRVAEKAVTNMAMNRMNMEAYCPMP